MMQKVEAAIPDSKQVIVLWVPAQRCHMLVLALVCVELPERKQ